MFFTNAWGSMLTRFSCSRKSNLMTDQNVSNLSLSCSTPLMKTKPSYGAFYVNGCVNRHNCRIWGTQQPNEIHEYVRGSPKVNVWCGLLYDRVIGPFFLSESTITGVVYLDLFEQYVFPQIGTFKQETVSRVIFMQDRAPPHFSCFVTDVLNEIPWRLDWKGWTNTLATSKPGPLSTWFFPVEVH